MADEVMFDDSSSEIREDLEIIEEYLDGVTLSPVGPSIIDYSSILSDSNDDESEQGEELEGPESKPAAITTSTMAEIYVSQGFIQKAIDIYAEMLAESPGNPEIIKRIDELAAMELAESIPVPFTAENNDVNESPSVVAESHNDSVVAKLETWLDNIHRRR